MLDNGTIVAMRYRIRGLIGSGGMGEVYRAEHVALGREVALKLLSPDFDEAHAVARFEREARTLSRLDHPGCVRVLDFGRTVDRRLYLAMELLAGPTLAAVLAREPVSTAMAARTTAQTLEALAHAHRRGVLHRDVKPENVILTWRDAEARAVLIDFGLAALRDDDPLTAAGICLGSPSYLAPERLLGRRCDARADLYSVGVVLYELLAGRRPFTGANPADVARGHIQRPPPPLDAGVSPSLAAIVRRALEKDPARRYQCAAEMLAAVASAPVDDEERRFEARLADAPTTAVARPRPPSRLLGWLRHGSWRW